MFGLSTRLPIIGRVSRHNQEYFLIEPIGQERSSRELCSTWRWLRRHRRLRVWTRITEASLSASILRVSVLESDVVVKAKRVQI